MKGVREDSRIWEECVWGRKDKETAELPEERGGFAEEDEGKGKREEREGRHVNATGFVGGAASGVVKDLRVRDSR